MTVRKKRSTRRRREPVAKVESKEMVVYDWSQEVEEEADLETVGAAKISVRNGSFVFGDNDLGEAMDVVIIAAAVGRAYYHDQWDPDNPVPPDCYASALKAEDCVPFDNSPNKQHDGPCQTCQWDEFGTSRRGGKACGERRNMIVLHSDALEESKELKAEIQPMFSVPVTSLGAWRTYANKIRKGMGRPIRGVITRVEIYNVDGSNYSLKFSHAGNVPDALGGVMRQLHGEAVGTLLAERDVSGYVPPEEEKKPRKRRPTGVKKRRTRRATA